MLKTVMIAATLASLAAPLAAQSVYGGGAAPCAAWNGNLKKRWPHLVDVDWLMGYLSGVSRSNGPGTRMMGDANVQAATAFIAQFCAANPQRPIFEAADALILQLQAAPRPVQ